MSEVVVPAGNEGAPQGEPAKPSVPAGEQGTPVAQAAPVAEPAAYDPGTGNQSLDVSLRQLAKTLNLKPDSPEIQELLQGNFKYMEGAAALIGKTDELAPFLALAKDGVEGLASAKKESETKLRAEVEGYAGDKETLDKALAFIREGSTQEQMQEVAGALDQGGLVARAMVELMLRQMNGSPNVTVQGAEAVQPGQSAVAASQAPAKFADRKAWRAAQSELISRVGYGYAETEEGKALMAAFPRA